MNKDRGITYFFALGERVDNFEIWDDRQNIADIKRNDSTHSLKVSRQTASDSRYGKQ